MSSQRWTRVIITLLVGRGVTGLAVEAPAQSKAAMTITSLRISVFRTPDGVHSTMDDLFCLRFSELLNFVSGM
jgi:hypothetical protein